MQRKTPTRSVGYRALTWPGRLIKKAWTLLTIHTTSWFVGLSAAWGETHYLALARAGMANPFVKRSYDLIADNMSSIELKVRKGRGDDAEILDEHPFLSILRRPNPQTGYQGFVQKIIAHLMFGGELFIYAPDSPLTGPNAGIPRPGGRITLLRPDRILEIEYDPATDDPTWYVVAPPKQTRRLRGSLFRRQETEMRIPAARVRHIKLYDPTSEDTGLPMLVAAWRQVQLQEKGDDWNMSISQHRGRPPGFFKYKGEGLLDDDQFKRTREQIQEAYKRDSRESLPGLLDGDYDWVPAGISQKDADFILGDEANGRKIAIALGVDPALLGDQGSRTLANLNEALRHLLLLKVLPVLDWLLDEWNHHYMPAYGEGFSLVYERHGIEPLQEDWDKKFRRLGDAIGDSLMSINEARADLRMQPRDEPEAYQLWTSMSREVIRAPGDRAADDDGDPFEQLARETGDEYKRFLEDALPQLLETVTRNGS